MKVVIVFLLVVFFSACGSHQVYSNKPYKPGATKGLVALSFTKSGLIQAPFRFHYRSKGGSVQGGVKISKPLDWSISGFKAITKKDEYIGQVIALQLPAGEYEFYELTIDDGYMGGDWDGGNTISFPFIVTESKVEYVGNLHIYSKLGLQHALGETLRFGYKRSDMRKRDLPVFYSRYKNINAQDVLFSSFEFVKK